jgi:hypothetical protein
MELEPSRVTFGPRLRLRHNTASVRFSEYFGDRAAVHPGVLSQIALIRASIAPGWRASR